MNSILTKIVNFVVILVLSLALVFFLFWRLGIFKKEAELGKEANEIRTKIEFVNNYPYQNFNQYLQNLPVTKIEIPQILPEEIGKPSLF